MMVNRILSAKWELSSTDGFPLVQIQQQGPYSYSELREWEF